MTGTMIPGVREENGLWYVGDQLVVPRTGSCREDLFQLVHNSMGHFGADKATTEDEGFNCILMITDQLGSNIQIILTQTDISAEGLALTFSKHWYGENGLPLDIMLDRDKLFVLKLWKALHCLTDIKLKMSTAYHPQTDGSSKGSNKTINQCLRLHVQQNQKGWVTALPLICFQIMNLVNGLTGYSGFQLLMGRPLRLIPPFLAPINTEPDPEADRAMELIKRIKW